MGDFNKIDFTRVTSPPREVSVAGVPLISIPPSQFHYSSLFQSPLLSTADHIQPTNKTPPREVSVGGTLPISTTPSQIHSPSLSRSPLLSSTDHIQPVNITPPREVSVAGTPPISTTPSQIYSPALSRSPLLLSADHIQLANKTPPREVSVAATPPISTPPSQFHSPSLSRSPLLSPADHIQPANKTPKNSTPRIRTPRFITPLGSPIIRALQLTRFDPHDAWLPITESRNGNAYYAAFHTLSSGIGIQALVLPVALTILGWTWGIITLTLAFIWQLYTLYLLVQLHESTETGMRYSRYMQLCSVAFGEKLAKWLALVPLMSLYVGTCIALIILGGQTCKMFFDVVCGGTCTTQPPTTVEWFLIFTSAAILLSQLPNMNSIAGVSLIEAITAVGYCTMIWVVSVAKGRMAGVSYNPVQGSTEVTQTFYVFNAIGIIAFAFRGHNLILEIQATMPSDEKHPSRVPMWKGVKIAYTLVAVCLFPLAIGGYWAYGQRISKDGGMLTALFVFHGKDTSQFILGLTCLFVIINALSSFQIYGMPTFDDLESIYVKKKKEAMPWWLRAIIRALFGYVCFFFGVAIPFLASMAGLVGGIALPVTLAYPCFMWVKVKKPKVFSLSWCINWVLGLLGMALTGVLLAAGIYVVIETGFHLSFFKPK